MAVDSLFSIKPCDYFCIKSHRLEFFLHYLLLCMCVPLPFTVYGTVIEFSQIKTSICITFGIPSIKHVCFSKLFSPTSATFPSWPNGSGYVASHENCMAFFFAKNCLRKCTHIYFGQVIKPDSKTKILFQKKYLSPLPSPRHSETHLFGRLPIF